MLHKGEEEEDYILPTQRHSHKKVWLIQRHTSCIDEKSIGLYDESIMKSSKIVGSFEKWQQEEVIKSNRQDVSQVARQVVTDPCGQTQPVEDGEEVAGGIDKQYISGHRGEEGFAVCLL